VLLSDAVDRFLGLQRARGNSINTIKTYDVLLRRVLTHVGNIPMRNLTHQHMEDVFYGPKGIATTQKSVNSFNNSRGMAAIFFRWARAEGLMQEDPMRNITARRKEHRERLRLTPEQMIAAIESCDYPRDRAAIAIAANTGMRASSIAALRVSDVDLEAGTIKYYNVKSRRERVLPITVDLDRELRRWFLYYRAECGPLAPGWYLVPARTFRWDGYAGGETQAQRSTLRPTDPWKRPSDLVHKVLGHLGVDGKGEGIHTFRRSSGRAVYEAALEAGDPRAIHLAQAFLDHEQASTTQAYIGTNFEQEKLHQIMRGKAFLTRNTDAVSESAAVVDLASRRRHKSG
jgi:integrase